MAVSSIVIKIKFGDTLRRYSAFICDEEFTFDMVMLRDKIRSLFRLSSDVDFTLTYIDEDGDVVTICDDNDLFEVASQSLNPLRITVRLNTDKLGGSYVRSSGSSSPLRSPQERLPSQTLNSTVSQILKSVPEPLHNALSKLLLGLATKEASSTPVLAEIIEKMQMTYLNKRSESQAGLSSSTHSGTTSENTIDELDIQDQPGSKFDEPSERLSGTNSEASTVKEHKVSVDAGVGNSNSKNKAVLPQKVTEGVMFGDVQAPRPVDLNVPYSDPETSQYLVNTKDIKGFGSSNCGDAACSFDYRAEAAFDSDSVLQSKDTVAVVETKKDSKNIDIESPAGVQRKSVGFGASNPDYLKHCLQDSNTTVTSGFPWIKTTKATNDSSSSSGWRKGMLNATNECPFTGMPSSCASIVHAYPYAPCVPPFKRSYNQGNGLGSIFHMGVRCDGCGVHPITGPRFKSKVKDDYDLCSICFEGMGYDADYIRMDRSVISGHPLPLKGFHDHSLRGPLPEMKPSRSKLDSHFILDINVLDGTIMAPSTMFTKIWRMRNNGTIVWPQGSQLLWIGGDKLSDTVSVQVEVPANGLPVDQELNIAVDFTAPELPGRYVSYWRMASPSGQKFGQRVWVLIQVDASMKDLGETAINLNLPPVSSYMRDPEVVNAKMDQDSALYENNFIRVMEFEDQFFDAQPPKDQEMNFPIDTLIIGNDDVSNTTTTPRAANPTMNFSEVLPTVPNAVQSPSTVAQVQPPASNLDQERNLLRELEEMGFKHVDLNKEILRMNEYNLEQSVYDLCRVLEWDSVHKELENGFLR